MKVFVAGGSGFIGRATVEALRAQGHDVVVASRTATNVGLPKGVEAVEVDVGSGPIDVPSLEGVDAVVNLVGIARPQGKNTFERAHVAAVRRLVELCRERGIRRFVHVSVVRVQGARGRYQETKARGEGVVVGSGLDWTIVRPALVYGPGDDMLTRLIELVRLVAVFPVPGGAPGQLQVVDVRDVAVAIARCIERPTTVGKTYDVVGPQKVSLAGLVNRVSDALEVTSWTPPVPKALMGVGATVAELVLPSPPITRAQLGMLVAGLYGEGAQTRRDLELSPRALTRERIVELAAKIPVQLPSLRLVPDGQRATWLASIGEALSPLYWFIPLALVLLLTMPAFVEHLWVRMAIANLVLIALAVGLVRIPWKSLWRPRPRSFAVGLGLGAAMYAGAQAALAMLGSVAPGFVAEASSVLGWAATVPAWIGIPALLAIVVAEDAVWRGAVTLPLAGRLGPWRGCAAAGLLFAVAHVTTGPPILWLAAFVAGFVWSAIAIRTRSLVATATCHGVWDLLMVVTGV